MLIVSGIQPTGNLHLGNYLGAIRNWVRMQDGLGAGDQCFFFLASLHAITVHNEPAQLRANIREMAAALIAAGVDPARRRVVVAPRGSLETVRAEVAEVNWLVEPPAAPFRCAVKLRAREAPRSATVAWDAASAIALVMLDEPGIVAPGQACVMYEGDRVLAGGFLRASGSVDRARAAA